MSEQQMDRGFVRNRTALELAIESYGPTNEGGYDRSHPYHDRRILDRAAAFLGFLQHGDA